MPSNFIYSRRPLKTSDAPFNHHIIVNIQAVNIHTTPTHHPILPLHFHKQHIPFSSQFPRPSQTHSPETPPLPASLHTLPQKGGPLSVTVKLILSARNRGTNNLPNTLSANLGLLLFIKRIHLHVGSLSASLIADSFRGTQPSPSDLSVTGYVPAHYRRRVLVVGCALIYRHGR